MEKPVKIQGMDVPIVKLTPLRRRQVSSQQYAKLLANIKAVGLIEPLCIYKEGDRHYILDGYLRYQALLELGIQTVPCLVLECKDVYTANRQVNHLSLKQEANMLRKALQTVDEKTLGQAFGMTALNSRLGMGLSKELHPAVAQSMEKGELNRNIARELTFVQPKRQVEILEMMRQAGDSSVAFAKAQILRTPTNLRSKKRHRATPWDRQQHSRRNLSKRLQEAEKHYDFYSALYRQYAADLLKLAIYVRQIVTRPRLRALLSEQYPDVLQLFESVMEESEGRAAV